MKRLVLLWTPALLAGPVLGLAVVATARLFVWGCGLPFDTYAASTFDLSCAVAVVGSAFTLFIVGVTQ